MWVGIGYCAIQMAKLEWQNWILPSDFWPTIIPFLSNKSNNCKKDMILEEDNKIINDQTEVSEIFNRFFINVSKDIGSNNIISPKYIKTYCQHIWYRDFSVPRFHNKNKLIKLI